jgi:hypothetical protein
MAVLRMQRVLAEMAQVAEQRRRGVRLRLRRVEIAANDGRHVPVRAAHPLLEREPGDQAVELPEAMDPRAIVQVEIDDRHVPAAHVEFGIEKALFADAALAERDAFRFDDRVPRKERVAVTEIEQTLAARGDAEDRVGEMRVPLEKFEMVEIARPAGMLVDLLQRHEIGPQLIQEMGDFQQVGLNLPAGGQPLDRRQAAAMCDIESDEAQPRRGHTRKDVA